MTPKQPCDLKKRSFEFSLQIIQFVRKMPRGFLGDVLCKQLLRAATSIGANIHEGFAGASRKDFINYYNIALKSANETIYWLELIQTSMDANTGPLSAEANEIAKILARSLITMRSKES